MSAEHITNQSHLKETNNRIVNTETTKLNNELAKDIKPLTKVPRIDHSGQIETSTIQQLISQQSDKTKQQITKQSYDYMRQTNSLINPELNEQLENEIDSFFNKKPLNTNDEVSLSSQAQKKTDEEPGLLSRNQGAPLLEENRFIRHPPRGRRPPRFRMGESAAYGAHAGGG